MEATQTRSCRTIGRPAAALLLAVGLTVGVGTQPTDADDDGGSGAPSLMSLRHEGSDAIFRLAESELTVSRAPSAAKSVWAKRLSSYRGDTSFTQLGQTFEVGWGQDESKAVLGTDEVWVAETAVKFDLSEIERGPLKLVERATLSFKETPLMWTNGDGQPVYKTGCVARLGIASIDWASAAALAALVPNQPWDAELNGKKAWDVRDHVQKMVDHPDDLALHHGFVLRGWMTLDQLSGEDDTRCTSTISEIELEVTVSDRPRPVLEAPPAPAPPPDLALVNIRGREEVEGGTGRTLSYLVEFRNDGADANGTVVVDIATSGVLTLADDQSVVRAGWAADGFTCAATASSGGANAGLRCSGGSLKKGQSTNPAIMVRITGPGYGYIHASIGVSGGPAEKDTSDQGLTLPVRVY